MPPWLIQIIIGLIINIIGYVLLASSQKPKPYEVKDAEDITAEAGRPVPVVWGSGTVKGLNITEVWDKESVKRNVSVEGGKK